MAPPAIAASKSPLMPMLRPAGRCDEAMSRNKAKCAFGRIVNRRNAHQSGDGETQFVPAIGDEGIGLFRHDTGLLQLRVRY